MSTYNSAYTAPFPSDTKITIDQAFEALRIKCREPMKFVPAIVACDVLEETSTFIKRKATTRDGKEMLEDMDLYKPALVTFKSNTGSFVTNLLSYNAEGTLLLTFTFSFPRPPHLTVGTVESAEWEKGMSEGGKVAVTNSINTTLEMFEEGKLN
ncbi:hypothetical protein RhiJN_12156 [Ceratobasidium sp. AG-Ba]|nr:hypothetical protein RhiJN_12156 [Ceratobasidium sp. AG-Ba]QRW12773.1 hypothetical protein RhiLY_11772 [Ceratobasidium sp. AG-Ba]